MKKRFYLLSIILLLTLFCFEVFSKVLLDGVFIELIGKSRNSSDLAPFYTLIKNNKSSSISNSGWVSLKDGLEIYFDKTTNKVTKVYINKKFIKKYPKYNKTILGYLFVINDKKLLETVLKTTLKESNNFFYYKVSHKEKDYLLKVKYYKDYKNAYKPDELFIEQFKVEKDYKNSNILQCAKGDCINGYAEAYYKNGDLFKGYFKNGLASGKGEYYFREGFSFEGEFINGVMDKGMYYFSNSDRFEGIIKDNFTHFDGTYYYNDRSKYVGKIINEKREGFGTFYDKDGYMVQGYWKGDKFTGYKRNVKLEEITSSLGKEKSLKITNLFLTSFGNSDYLKESDDFYYNNIEIEKYPYIWYEQGIKLHFINNKVLDEVIFFNESKNYSKYKFEMPLNLKFNYSLNKIKDKLGDYYEFKNDYYEFYPKELIDKNIVVKVFFDDKSNKITQINFSKKH